MINLGQVLGRVGKIETRATQAGMKVTNISMVTSKTLLKNGQKEEKVTWHNVTLFNKIAEIAEKYVAIGDLLYIRGEMENQQWTDKNGQQRTNHFIIANEMKLMPKSKEHKPAPQTNTYEQVFPDEEVPF